MFVVVVIMLVVFAANGPRTYVIFASIFGAATRKSLLFADLCGARPVAFGFHPLTGTLSVILPVLPSVSFASHASREPAVILRLGDGLAVQRYMSTKLLISLSGQLWVAFGFILTFLQMRLLKWLRLRCDT